MSGVRLSPRRIEKVWGRRDLAPWFDSVGPEGEPVGEIWFEAPDGALDSELLVKFLFTSERLSVQVHPDDNAARARGMKRGKNEAWYVLDAEPHASIGLGMREVVSREALRRAALDGSIVGLMHWQAVKPGDCFFAPARTVHAIGAGIKLVEVQQNSDTTYRLYDYGRPRELHLDDGVAVADPAPWVASTLPYDLAPGRRLLVAGPAFMMEQWHLTGGGTLKPAPGRACHMVVLAGRGSVASDSLESDPSRVEAWGDSEAEAWGEPLRSGEVWLFPSEQRIRFETRAEVLVAYPADGVVEDLWRPAEGMSGAHGVTPLVAEATGQE